MIPVGSYAITTEDIFTIDNCLKKGSRVKILYVNDKYDTYTIMDENGWEIYGVWSCSLVEARGVYVKFNLIRNWQEKNLRCHFCGKTQSVKYTMNVHDPDISDKEITICVCNKCVLLNANKEVTL